MKRHLAWIYQGGPRANCSTTDSTSSSDSSGPAVIELREWKASESNREPPVGDNRKEKTLKSPHRERLFLSGLRDRRGTRTASFLSCLKSKSITIWGALLLQLLLATLGPYASVAVETATTGDGFQGESNKASLLQHQQNYHFLDNGAPPRQLSSAAAWAAEVEGALRLSPRLSLYLGVFLTLSGSLLMAGGSTLMKLGLSIEDEYALRSQSCDQQWLWGFTGELLLFSFCLPLFLSPCASLP